MIYLPEEIQKRIAEQEYAIDEIGMSDSTVIMFEDSVLKIQSETLETQGEIKMLQWLEGKLPVPKVLSHVTENGKSYLLMSRMDGQMACEEKYLENPKLLASVLAQSMKKLWEIDVTTCPVRMDLDVKLRMARENIKNGLVDMDNVEPDTFGENGFKGPDELLQWLVANKPEEELVLSHGDYCLPNIFIKEEALAGYIDLGRMGIADKWVDIAICYRSLLHNYAGKYTGKVYDGVDSNLLFEELGIEPDWNKIRYYILLDELF